VDKVAIVLGVELDMNYEVHERDPQAAELG
jgi:hypothetical protein